MMRTINISSSVFAAIWKRHEEGEDSEDAILRRLLNLPKSIDDNTSGTGRMLGFYDEKSGVHFPQNMRIYRVYKGHKREAIAQHDRWFVPASGQSFHSLHKLSQSVNNNGNENAWMSWKYRDEDTGEEHLIDQLRKGPVKDRK